MLRLLLSCLLSCSAVYCQKICERSPTTASGTFAPKTICAGDVIFEDDFDTFNLKKWQHENTLAGGGVRSSNLIETGDGVSYDFVFLELGIPMVH